MDVGQKKTPIAPTPILENFSHVCVNYNGVTKTTPCNLNGIGVAATPNNASLLLVQRGSNYN